MRAGKCKKESAQTYTIMNLSRACHRAMVLVALIEVLLVLVPDLASSASSKSKKTAKKSKSNEVSLL